MLVRDLDSWDDNMLRFHIDTARCLCGMLQKVCDHSQFCLKKPKKLIVNQVGLLPKGNTEQVPFAYDLYAKTGLRNTSLSERFLKTFSQVVSIDFLGIW